MKATKHCRRNSSHVLSYNTVFTSIAIGLSFSFLLKFAVFLTSNLYVSYTLFRLSRILTVLSNPLSVLLYILLSYWLIQKKKIKVPFWTKTAMLIVIFSYVSYYRVVRLYLLSNGHTWTKYLGRKALQLSFPYDFSNLRITNSKEDFVVVCDITESGRRKLEAFKPKNKAFRSLLTTVSGKAYNIIPVSEYMSHRGKELEIASFGSRKSAYDFVDQVKAYGFCLSWTNL